MGYFQVRYDSRGVNYDRRGFIRLATGWCVLRAPSERASSPIHSYIYVNVKHPKWVLLNFALKSHHATELKIAFVVFYWHMPNYYRKNLYFNKWFEKFLKRFNFLLFWHQLPRLRYKQVWRIGRGVHHRSVDSYVPTILQPGFESQVLHLLRFYHLKSNLFYICHVKRTKINKKEAEFGP